MKRYAREKTPPPVKPVQRVEVSDKHRKLKWVLAAVFLALGVTLIAFGVREYFNQEPGWQIVGITSTEEASCSGEFVFNYLYGAGDLPANIEAKELGKLYTEATVHAYRLFSEDTCFEGVYNPAYLNAHPGEAVTVEEPLYRAFSLLEQSGTRALYLAPVYNEYRAMFSCDRDDQAALYDPAKDPEQAEYISALTAFVCSEDAVKLELLGDNRVRLLVSEEYQSFAESWEITSFIDFFWMKNAFIADYLAERMTEKGFTNGTISSFDGFSRNLDTTDRSYRLNLFDKQENTVYQAAVMEYQDLSALVALRAFPVHNMDSLHYYAWQDGTVSNCYIDPLTGKSTAATSSLTGYGESTCGEILTQLLPVYLKETLDTEALDTLAESGIQTVYFENGKLLSTDDMATFLDFYSDDRVTYTKG